MITDTGYVIKSEEDYYDDIMYDLKTEFPDMSESPSNLLVILARIWAKNENRRDYDASLRYSYAYVATATGDFLNKAVRTAGISRIEGNHAIGSVLITKDPEYSQILLLPETKIKSGSTIYKTTNTSTLIINSETEEVEIKSIDVGISGNIPLSSKFNTIESLLGIKSIVASTEISGGSDIETDAELRARYYIRIASYSNSSLEGIIDRVKAVSDVTRAGGKENNTSSIVDGLVPNSFIIYANGGTVEDIAQAIFESKPAGIQSNGDVSVEVELDGNVYDIKFSRFSTDEIYYDVEVAIDRTISPSTILDDIKDAIVEYTEANSSIVAYELSGYINKNIESAIGVSKLNFGTSENPTSNTSIEADAGKIFNADIDNIKVVVI